MPFDRENVPIKGHSVANKPILGAKPSLQDVSWNGQVIPQGVKLWMIGTDTSKDYLSARWKFSDGPGAIHFSQDLPKDYYEQLTAEYCITVWRRGHKVRVWEKKKNDRNEAGDLMVYALACAYYLGLHKKNAAQWKQVREFVDPDTRDLFLDPPVDRGEDLPSTEQSAPPPPPALPIQSSTDPWQTPKPQPKPAQPRRAAGRPW